MSTRTKRITLLLLTLLTGVFLGYIVYQYFIVGPAGSSIGAGKGQDFPELSISLWETMLLIHIVGGSIALLIGPLQLRKRSQTTGVHWHRRLGKLYAVSILIGAIAGFYLSYYSNGGLLGHLAFLLLNVTWLVTTFVAIQKVRQKNIQEHRVWMLRSYATTLGFVTFRLLVPLLVIAGLPFQTTFPVGVFLSLAINLLLVEWYVRRAKRATTQALSA